MPAAGRCTSVATPSTSVPPTKLTSVATRGLPTECRSRPFVACCQRDAGTGEQRQDEHPPRYGGQILAGEAQHDGAEHHGAAGDAPHRHRDDAGRSVPDAVEHQPVQGLAGATTPTVNSATPMVATVRPWVATVSAPARPPSSIQIGMPRPAPRTSRTTPARPSGRTAVTTRTDEQSGAERDERGGQPVGEGVAERSVDARLHGGEDSDKDRAAERDPRGKLSTGHPSILPKRDRQPNHFSRLLRHAVLLFDAVFLDLGETGARPALERRHGATSR